MNIKITSDSTVDLPDSILNEYNISIAHYSIVLGEQLLTDRVNCTPDTIYDFVAREKKLPKTSAINAESFTELFSTYAAEYDHVIHIGLSSGISLACENAIAASKAFDNVTVVDSKALSTGVALLVLLAADLAKQGLEPQEIVSRLETARDHLQVSFVVDTMEYLHKGGRCSGLAAFVASTLRIKPTITMDPITGKMKPAKKYMASSSKAIMRYVDDTLANFNTPDLTRIFVTHTSVNPEIVEQVKKRVAEVYPFTTIIETMAGSTITSHCGKGTLGILYINAPQ